MSIMVGERARCVIPKSTPVKYKEFTSPSAKTKTCTACFTNIKEKYKVPKDHTLHLFEGGEKTDQCKVVERYLQTSFTERDFAVICRSCHKSASSAINTQEAKIKQLKTGREEVVPRYARRQIKRGIPSDSEGETQVGQKKKFLNFPGAEIYEIHDKVLHVGLGLNVSDVHHLPPVPSTEQIEK